MSFPVNKDLNHSYFHKIDTEQKAYWLGFILGDGCLWHNRPSIEIGLNIKDELHIDKFAKAIGWRNKKQYKADRNAVTMIISSREMYNDLVNLGLTSRKSFTATWPKIYKKYERHMLRGLFDADGTITNHSYWKDKPYASWALVGTKECLENAKRILSITNEITPDHSIWRIKKNGTPGVFKIFTILYRGSTVWLDRKLEKFKEFYPLFNE